MAVLFPDQIATLERPDWQRNAACRGKSKWFFAPEGERRPFREFREQRAQLICTTCPVHDECRTFAREHLEFGFWAGESEAQRAMAGFPCLAPVGLPRPSARRRTA